MWLYYVAGAVTSDDIVRYFVTTLLQDVIMWLWQGIDCSVTPYRLKTKIARRGWRAIMLSGTLQSAMAMRLCGQEWALLSKSGQLHTEGCEGHPSASC
jgi:hypothetical protein